MASPEDSMKNLPDNMNSGLRLVLKKTVGFLLRLLFGLRLVRSERFLETGPCLVVANHKSLLDIPALCTQVKPWLYFVAKRELFEGKFAARFLRWWGAVPIDRENISIASVRQIKTLIQEGKHVVIFPQGTRVKDDSKRSEYRVHTGTLHFASRFNAPVIPVCVHGDFRFLGRTEIVFGNPLFLKSMPKGKDSKAESERMATDLMEFIYELGENPDTAKPHTGFSLTQEETTERLEKHMLKWAKDQSK